MERGAHGELMGTVKGKGKRGGVVKGREMEGGNGGDEVGKRKE